MQGPASGQKQSCGCEGRGRRGSVWGCLRQERPGGRSAMFVREGVQTRDSDGHSCVRGECGGQLGRDGVNCALKRVDGRERP